jgi:tetratricopeptide (TPR) repeat protein
MRKFTPIKTFIPFILTLFLLLSILVLSQDWRGKGRVRGVVLTEDGKPIPNAKVIFQSDKYNATFEVITDEKGKWVVMGIRGGKWNIDFVAPGYEPMKISTQVSEILRAKPIEIRLKKTAKALATEKITALLEKGNELFAQKNYQEALIEYQNILSENPKLYQINLNIGNCYYEMGDYEKAISSYQAILEKEPDSHDALMSLANIYLEKGDLDRGLEYIKKIDLKTIDNPITFYNIGTLLYNKGKPDLAIEYYLNALRLDPNFGDAYYQLGLCYLNTNEKEKAKKIFNKYLEIAPDSDKAEQVRGFLQYLKNSK